MNRFDCSASSGFGAGLRSHDTTIPCIAQRIATYSGFVGTRKDAYLGGLWSAAEYRSTANLITPFAGALKNAHGSRT